MSDNNKNEFITPNKKNRPTIGLLIDDLSLGYQQAVWRGVVEGTNEKDVNLITLVGAALDDPNGYSQQANVIYDLISKKNLDGLIIMSGALFSITSPETVHAFIERYRSLLPLVSIAMSIEKVPSLLVDNYGGMYEIVTHLIEEHNYQNIAFIQQYEGNPEFDERYRGYTDALAAHDIPLNPLLVVPPNYDDAPDQALSLLLDERKVTLDAIVTGDDHFAIPLQEYIQTRGIQVPDEIAVVGFDDIEDSQFTSPPLTTVRQPLQEQGKHAVDLILAQLHKEVVHDTINLPTELMVRQSCGCLLVDIRKMNQLDIRSDVFDDMTFEGQRDVIIAEIMDVTSTPIESCHWVEEILEAYSTTLQTQHFETFLHITDRILNQIAKSGSDIFRWQGAITVLRRYTLAILKDKSDFIQADNLLHQIRMMIAELGQRYQARLRVQANQQAIIFRDWGQSLTTAGDMKEVLDLIALGVPTLGIHGCALIMYKEQDPTADQFQLILANESQGRVKLSSEGEFFPRTQLIPDIIFSENRAYSFVIESLHYRENNFGYAIFEVGPLVGSSYRGLAEYIGSALQNINAVKQIENRSIQIQTASEISRAASNILESEELIQEMVDLIKARFDLYYAGIFLVDEDRQWAILRAGTGGSGEKMIAENWRLDVGGGSMIGRSIVTGEADIQLDIDKAPVHLRNPHLPETKSEMALPLFSRGEVLGALTIQSEHSNAFSAEDVQVLQTMANQIATSIANAHLFGQTQNALLDSETLLNISRIASSSIEIEASLEQVLNLTLKSTGIEAGLFSILNPATNQLEISAHKIPDSFLENLQTNGLDGTLCDLVYRQKKSIIVQNLAEDSPIDAAGLIKLGYKSYQGVPIETKGEIFGTLCTFSKSILRAEDSQIILLQAIGQQVGVAIQNSILFEQTQIALAETAQQTKHLSVLNELSEKLADAETLDDIYLVSASVISQIVPADRTSFANLMDNGTHVELLAVSGDEGLTPTGTILEIEGTPLGDAIKSRSVVSFPDADNKYAVSSNLAAQDLESYLVVPLMVSGRAIGTLNFGWTNMDGLSNQNRDLAVQTGSLISNAIANRSLLQQTQDTLAELEATQRRYQLQAWSTYNRTRASSGYQKTPDGLEPLGKQQIPEVDKVIHEQTPVIEEDGKNLTLTIPIMLRDQPIGAIGIQADENKPKWSTEEINLAQEISEQFALAAESIRLLDETQRRAARERLVAEITTKIRANNDPQTMIQTAAQELQEALQAKRTQVIFQPDATEPDHSERGDE